MNTLQLASDLHLERRDLPYEQGCVLQPSADILALVGDIGSPYGDRSLDSFLGWCSARWRHVLYVPGNHEYYNKHGMHMEFIDKKLEDMCSKYPNVYFMQKRALEVGQHMFLGTTLWSPIPAQHADEIAALMPDYQKVYTKRHVRATYADISAVHQDQRAWLEQQIGSCMAAGRQPVLLTHHAPTLEGTSHPKYANSVLSHAYASQLHCPPGIVRLWCCGHTHYNFCLPPQLASSDCANPRGYELVSNQYGSYPTPARFFNSRLCIQL